MKYEHKNYFKHACTFKFIHIFTTLLFIKILIHCYRQLLLLFVKKTKFKIRFFCYGPNIVLLKLVKAQRICLNLYRYLHQRYKKVYL